MKKYKEALLKIIAESIICSICFTGKFRLMENIFFRIKIPIFNPIIELQMTAVNVIKINVSHRRGLNTRNIRRIIEQMVSPNDCDIIKLTKKLVPGLVKDNTSAIAVHMTMV
jgi:hypothetical protein